MRSATKVWKQGYRARLYSSGISTKDQRAQKAHPTWPPTEGTYATTNAANATDSAIHGLRSQDNQYYIGYLGLIFDTSAIPSNAKVLGGHLELVLTNDNNSQGLPLQADYVPWLTDDVSPTWSYPQDNSAIANFASSKFILNEIVKIPLRGVSSGITPGGKTYIRLGLKSNEAPLNFNFLTFAMSENTTLQGPRLVVSYIDTKLTTISVAGVSTAAFTPVPLAQQIASAVGMFGGGTFTPLPIALKGSALTVEGRGGTVASPLLRKGSGGLIAGIGSMAPLPTTRRGSAVNVVGRGSMTPAAVLRRGSSASIFGRAALLLLPTNRKGSVTELSGRGGASFVGGSRKGSSATMAGRTDILVNAITRRFSGTQMEARAGMVIHALLRKGSKTGMFGDSDVATVAGLTKLGLVGIDGVARVVISNIPVEDKVSALAINSGAQVVFAPLLTKASGVTIEGDALSGFTSVLRKNSITYMNGAGTFISTPTARKLGTVGIMGSSDLSLFPITVKGATLSVDGRAALTLSNYVPPADFDTELEISPTLNTVVEVSPALIAELIAAGVLDWSNIEVVPGLDATLEVV